MKKAKLDHTRIPLSDGSVCIIEPIEGTVASSLISRQVDGQIVWGQAFGKHGPDAVREHWAQVEEIIESMNNNPQAYVRYPGREHA